jgi:integrase
MARKSASVFPYRGKYRIQYLDSFGRTRTKTADTRKAAYELVAQLQLQQQSGFLNPKNTEMPTVSQWLSSWLEKKRLEVSPTTIWGYESHINNYLVPLMGNLKLGELAAFRIQDLYGYLQTDEGLSPGTVRKVHSLLAGALAMAANQGVIFHNPMQQLKPPKYSPKPPEVYSATEVERLLQSASYKAPGANLRWLFALRYGMRQGEVLGLRFEDFDLVQKTVQITRTVNSLPGKGVVSLPVKSKHSNRKLPVDSEAIGLLSQMRGVGWLFCETGSMPIDASCDQRRWRALVAAAGVRYLPLHSARHSVATILMSQGANPKAVQMLLGHSSPAYTLATYVHPQVDDLRVLLAGDSQVAKRPRSGLQILGSNHSALEIGNQ